MLVIKPYRRDRAVEYARRYAFSQNPLFSDFEEIGGNCTNFVSQCVYAGSCKMNYTKTFGWYFISLNERSPSWSGVEFFYNFITANGGVGPFGREVTADEVEIGDVIQLAKADGNFYHTLLIVGFDGEEILVSAQSVDAFMRPLSEYEYDISRFIKIDGVRTQAMPTEDCFDSVYNGIAIIAGEGGAMKPIQTPVPTPPTSEGTPPAPNGQAMPPQSNGTMPNGQAMPPQSNGTMPNQSTPQG